MAVVAGADVVVVVVGAGVGVGGGGRFGWGSLDEKTPVVALGVVNQYWFGIGYDHCLAVVGIGAGSIVVVGYLLVA